MSDKQCRCVNQHVPEVHAPAVHHILPQSWGGQSVPENMIVLCPTTHENVHQLLNLYVHAKGAPAWEVRRNYSAYARGLAAQAWEQRPEHPVYTIQQHAAEEQHFHD